MRGRHVPVSHEAGGEGNNALTSISFEVRAQVFESDVLEVDGAEEVVEANGHCELVVKIDLLSESGVLDGDGFEVGSKL